MGLPPSAEVRPGMTGEGQKGIVERVEGALGLGGVLGWGALGRKKRPASEMIYSRARFEAGEVDVLRDTFNAKASSTHTTEKNEEEKVVEKEVLFDLVKSLPGYEAIKVKDFNYVLEETGYTRAENVDFDAFVEVGPPGPPSILSKLCD